MRCPRCGSSSPAAQGACAECGYDLDGPTLRAEPTETLAGAPPAATMAPGAAGAGAGQRFVPGVVVERRYRILGLLGKGGMGEVYRADDLKLGHPVALKFLPEAFGRDPAALERFLGEVRTARRVSHPNVCRVHDVGEAGGQHFLSMEFIDGEDLASLLRRIGRLPGDKALEIAGQICAGLAAAHESGVLHRDLKPANVMIDGRGRARITDFGLAGLAGSFEGGEVAGTPSYMAPEQLRGARLCQRSDLYALGLVLYELFTGKRAFAEGATLGDLLRTRESVAPPAPGQLVKDLDPRVERAILRCLEKDPAARPGSVAELQALLPAGGDPLAAALAAGETPSPELVAAGGEEGSLPPWAAAGALLILLGALAALAYLAPGATIAGVARPLKPPEALAETARALLAAAAPPADQGYDFGYDWEYLAWRGAERRLASGLPPATPLYFWYRSSPEPMRPERSLERADPPLDLADMAVVRLDAEGRLLALTRVPPTSEPGEPGPPGAPPRSADWHRLLAATALDLETLEPSEPRWLPPYFADERRAWVARLPGSELPLRVEAAAVRGQPFYFEVVPPWRQPERLPAPPRGPSRTAADVLLFLLLGGAVALGLLLARRNLQLGRADLQGATRLAKVVAVSSLAGWLALAHLPPAFAGLFDQLLAGGIYRAALSAAVLFMLYLALEPFLRRHAPRLVVSWTRLFEGRFRDPLVGRDLLAGLCFGVLMALAIYVRSSGSGVLETHSVHLDAAFYVVPLLLLFLPQHIFLCLASLLLYQLLARRIRSDRSAGIVIFVLLFTLHALFIGTDPYTMVFFAVICGLLTYSMVRFGLLAMAIQYLSFLGCLYGPITADRQVIHFGGGLFYAALILLAGGYGAWVSLGRRPLLSRLYDDVA